MLDTLTSFILAFSHETVIIPLFIFGYFGVSRPLFFHAICLLLCNMLFNGALKEFFQIPLNPALGKVGFAFPSGHMQNSVVFYGWLYLVFPNPLLRSSLRVLLLGIAGSLVYCGYHNANDIMGAFVFAALLLAPYFFLVKYKKAPLTALFLCSTLSLLYIQSINGIKPHQFMAYYALIGLFFSERLFSGAPPIQTRKIKGLAIVLCFLLVTLVHFAFTTFPLPSYMLSLRWLILGASIPAAHMLSYLESRD